LAATPKALVLGSDSGSFLSVVRSLGRRGIEVHVGWCPADAPAARSRYIRRHHQIPRAEDGSAWVDAFAALMERERFDLVLPTNDPTLIPLQIARAQLEPRGRIYLLSDRAFEITFDKVKTRDLALDHGVPIAPGQVVTEPAEIDAALEGRRYPLVIKPQASFNPWELDHRNWVTRVYRESDARAAAAGLLDRGQVLIEENVAGVGWGVEVLARGGEILLSQQHQRLHEPLHGGGSSYRRTVPRNPEFMQAVTRLVHALDYTGVAMFEFKGDPSTGRWVLIEINGRFWGSLPLALAAGLDFPYALWELLVHGRTCFSDGYRLDVYARNFKRDLKWLWLNLRADRTDPVLATVPLPRVAAELTHVARRREHSDQFVRDDPRPGLAELRQLGGAVLDVVQEQVAERTPAHHRHRRAARRALAEARTVLFVCYGNICRSPFAAGVARSALPGSVRVASAGTSADAGRRSPSVARAVAHEFGVDLENHRSLSVNRELIEQADAIFVFDQRNRSALRRRFPEANGKVHFLGALGPGPLAIGDPIGGDHDRFRRTYSTIAAALGVSSAQ
jgi:protein-tyrosine-phosphatase/predicted ATP-grasp superfamily ATP-dependent carboligase